MKKKSYKFLLLISFVLNIVFFIILVKNNIISLPSFKKLDDVNIILSNRVIDREGNNLFTVSEAKELAFLNNNDYISRSVKFTRKYNKDSQLIWEKEIKTHHELEIGEDGNIYTLGKEVHEYNGQNITFDVIIGIDQSGNRIYNWSTFDHLKEIQKYHSELEINQINKFEDKKFLDYYHANSVDYIPSNKNDKDQRFKQGNLILSLLFPDLILIIDKETGNIVWNWGPNEINHPHTPRMLKNGNIIIFENGPSKKYSRIIELNPISKKIVWEYIANPPESFYSDFNGAVQELPNGNLLVTNSVSGHVFEITKNKKIVWEFYNPIIDKIGYRELIYRASYVDKEKVETIVS